MTSPSKKRRTVTKKKAPPERALPRKAAPRKAPPLKAKKAPAKKKRIVDVRRKETREKKAPDFRSTFLKSLAQKKEEVERSLEKLKSSRKEYDGQSTAGDFIDEVDDAQREISAYSHYSLIERKTKELQRINNLIARIQKAEEFGLCEECGTQIPKERLLIVPEATLCVACQRELERMDQRKFMVSRPPTGFGPKREVDWEGSDGLEEEDGMMIEYHISTVPVVDIEDTGPEDPPEEKEEK